MTLHGMRADNWVHFPVTVPLQIGPQRLTVESIVLLFNAAHCRIGAIHIYDGSRKVRQIDPGAQATGDHAIAVDDTNTFRLDPPVAVQTGLGISVNVMIDPGMRPEMTFAAVGVVLTA